MNTKIVNPFEEAMKYNEAYTKKFELRNKNYEELLDLCVCHYFEKENLLKEIEQLKQDKKNLEISLLVLTPK